MILADDLPPNTLETLLGRFGLSVVRIKPAEPIPGSFWGDSEAGLIGDQVFYRADTPLHSVLHESCHYVCMDAQRRDGLHTDAAGDYDEENGVCYLQLLLADQLQQAGKERLFRDMDDWGYSFRLGSSRAWFYQDAEDAADWLRGHGLIDTAGMPTWRVRG